MSRKIHAILLILFLLFIHGQTSYSQIDVRLYQPPPNQLTVEHLWNFDLINNTTQTFYVSLTGIATEVDAGLIFEARSSFFELQPGLKRVTVPEISPISVSYSDPDYEDIVLKTGSVPTGNYEICIVVIDEESGEELGRDCLQQFVEHTQPPQLISPFDEATLSEPFPVFTWMHPGMTDGTFTLNIVEILDGQTPLEAIQSNPPWFEGPDIVGTAFQYPIHAREMTRGQKYAWQVLVSLDDAEFGASEIRTFTYGETGDVTATIQLLNPQRGEALSTNKPYFEWSATDMAGATFTLTMWRIPQELATSTAGDLQLFEWRDLNQADATLHIYQLQPDLVQELNGSGMDMANVLSDYAPVFSLEPFFQRTGIEGQSYRYSETGEKRLLNRRYFVWQITAMADDQILAKSPVGKFQIFQEYVQPPGAGYGSLVDGRIFGRSFLLQKKIYEDLTTTSTEMTSENILFEPDTLHESFSVAWKDTIAKIESGENATIGIAVLDEISGPVAMNMHYRNAADSAWKLIGADSDSADGWNVTWNTENMTDGFYEIRVQAVNQNNDIATNYMAVQVGDLPRPSEIALNENQVVFSVDISEADIRRKLNEAERERTSASQARERRRELERQRNQRARDYRNASTRAEELRRIDEVLDNMPATFQGRVKTLLDSLEAIRARAGGVPNQAALQAAVNDAQRRLDDCKKRLEDLKQEQQELQQKRDDLKKQQDDLLKQLDKMHHDDGWIGESGFHDDGRVWWGYVGDENSTLRWGSPGHTQARQLQRNIKDLNREYRNTLAQLEQLAASIAEAGDDCAELEDLLKQAQEAKKNGDEYQATQTTIDEICREIRSLMQPLVEWCNDNPDHCNFGQQLDQLSEDCPEDEAGWQRFWRDFENVKNRKKSQEDTFGREAERAGEDIGGLDDEIQEANEEAREHARNARDAEAEAERLRQERARQIKEEAHRRRQQQQQQDAENQRLRRLLQRAENEDESAIRQLMTEFGLSAIGETSQAAGNLVVILKGLLVLKNMPDCACKIMEVLKQLLNPQNNDATINALSALYLEQWRDCTGLPAISSVAPGTEHVADMVRQIPDDTKRRAVQAIDRIIAVKCR